MEAVVQVEPRSAQNAHHTRRLVLGLVAGAPVAALAACAPGGAEQARPGGTASGPVTVRIMDRVGSEEEVYPQRIPAFQAAHPNITVQYELTPEWGAAKTTTLAAAGALGDLGHMFVNTQDYHH